MGRPGPVAQQQEARLALQQLLIPRGMLGGYAHGPLRGAQENVQVAIAIDVTYGNSHPSIPVLIFNARAHNCAIGLLHEE